LTAVSGALSTSSASSVINKDSQSEHEPTTTVGKQMQSHPIDSSSTIANIVDKPGHNEAFYWHVPLENNSVPPSTVQCLKSERAQ
jgi:hypothetical protein